VSSLGGIDVHLQGKKTAMQAIVSRRESRFATLIELFRCYSIRTLVKLISTDTAMVPKLGNWRNM
jgi:hypothetical protein